MLGYRPDEVVGRSIKFLYGPSTDTTRIQAAIKDASLDRPNQIDVVLYGRTGISHHLEMRCTSCQGSEENSQLKIELRGCLSENYETMTFLTQKPFIHEVVERVCIAQHVKSFSRTKKFICFQPQSSIEYLPFCDDFGPMNLACIARFIMLLDRELASGTASKIVYCIDAGKRPLTNAVFLLGAYMLLKLNLTADQVQDRFSWLDGRLIEAFRDATYTESDFDLTLQDCWRGLERGMAAGWIRTPTDPSSEMWGRIDMRAYVRLDNPHNGDLHVVVPGKLVAFRGPRDPGPSEVGDAGGLPPRHYAPVLRELGVASVVRLNEAEYGAEAFAACGIAHHDLPFDDCAAPPAAVVRAFLQVVDAAPGAVAVHCHAGLGRTGTLIAVCLMRSYGFAAREAIGWLRIVRPGSVIGEQQHYLCALDCGSVGLARAPATAGPPALDANRRRAAQAGHLAAAAERRRAAARASRGGLG